MFASVKMVQDAIKQYVLQWVLGSLNNHAWRSFGSNTRGYANAMALLPDAAFYVENAKKAFDAFRLADCNADYSVPVRNNETDYKYAYVENARLGFNTLEPGTKVSDEMIQFSDAASEVYRLKAKYEYFLYTDKPMHAKTTLWSFHCHLEKLVYDVLGS